MSILCWMFGHKFPVKYVSDHVEYYGSCSRCRIVAADADEIAYCWDCGHAVMKGDDDTTICIEHGGRSRRAIYRGGLS